MRCAKGCLLLCFLPATFAQPAGRGVISGTVVDASGGETVRKAVVTMTWHGTPRSWATTRTDGSGRFTFEGLPAGKYDLRATKAGLGTATYGASSVRELGDQITLADGETRGDLKLRFQRFGSLTGRVVDQDGDPIPAVSVNLFRAGRNLGERVLLNYRNANTNDRGEYQISPVDPGEYYLRCNTNLPRQMGLASQDIVVPQFYGGARELKDAAVLNLRGGEVLSGLDFHLTAERPAKITGRVTGVPPLDSSVETPGAGLSRGFSGLANGRQLNRGGGQAVMVDLSPAGDDQMGWSNATAAQGPEYRFEMPENSSGRYRIQASIHAKGKTYYASQVIDAREGTNEVVLALVPGVELKGHLKVEGPGVHPVENFTIALTPPGSGPRRESYSAHVGKDGGFAIEQVPPGEWLLNINPTPGGMFEKSVLLGKQDFLFKRIEIPPGLDAPLNVVISSNTAVVEGEIDAGGADAKRAGILLEPVGKRHTLARFYHSAIADDSGKFKLSGIAPGKYKLFALEKIATESYRNPEAGDLLDALGEEFEVLEGARIQSQPKLIPEQKAKEILNP